MHRHFSWEVRTRRELAALEPTADDVVVELPEYSVPPGGAPVKSQPKKYRRVEKTPFLGAAKPAGVCAEVPEQSRGKRAAEQRACASGKIFEMLEGAEGGVLGMPGIR